MRYLLCGVVYRAQRQLPTPLSQKNIHFFFLPPISPPITHACNIFSILKKNKKKKKIEKKKFGNGRGGSGFSGVACN